VNKTGLKNLQDFDLKFSELESCILEGKSFKDISRIFHHNAFFVKKFLTWKNRKDLISKIIPNV
jgi:hypothetical protein